MGEYVSITSGEAPSKFEEGTELYVKVDDLNYNDKYVVDTQNKVAEHSTVKRATKGSVVFPKRGAAIITNKVRILGIDSYMDTNMMALTSERLDSEFLYNIISKEGLYKIADTSTIPQINNKHIEPYEVKIPSLDEQRRIGVYFKQLDHLITLHQRQPFLHSTPEISLTVQLIHPFYTSSWEQRKFSDVVATRRGLTYKPSDIRKNGVRVLRSSNIAEDSFVLSDEDVFVVREAVNIDCVRANDILITAANGSSRLVGKHTIISGIPEESAVHGGFMLLGTTKEPHFVNASMGSSWYRRFIELFVAGGNGAIGNLNKNDLDNQDIAIPSEKEQKKIGSFFRQLDNLITLHQRKGKAAVTGCSNDANNSKGVYCKARDFGYKCCKKVESP